MTKAILAEKDLQAYRRDGFVAPIPVLSMGEVTVLRQAINEHLSGIVRSERYELTDEIRIHNVAAKGEPPRYEYVCGTDDVVLHTFPFLFNLWKVDPRFARIAHKSVIVKIARELLNSAEVLLFEDNVVIKAPGSKYLPWHQDYSYWPLGEPTAVTIWIALDDIGPKNGAMELAPGTQHLGERLPVSFGKGRAFMGSERPGIPEVPSDPKSLGHAVLTYKLRAGECGAHDALVWHGSTANNTSEVRRALVLRYVSAGTLWLGNSRMAYEDVGCAVGDRLTSAHFPLAGACPGEVSDETYGTEH